MEIEEILASEKAGMQFLRSIRLRHSQDAVTQGLVADALENVVERVIKLNDLYHSKDEPGRETNGNGQLEAVTGGT